jgi:hypothetical protein
MYIETVPNRASPPAILLRESWREDGKVHKRTLLNLTHWDPAHVEGLRAVLKGGTVSPHPTDPDPAEGVRSPRPLAVASSNLRRREGFAFDQWFTLLQ